MGVRNYEAREHFLPGPKATSGYRTVLILGATGSGKTTLIRQLIGTQATGEEFPAVSQAKTTVAESEILLAPGDYYAVVTFLGEQVVRTLIEENLVAAAEAITRRRSDEPVLLALLEHTEQRFRLHYLLGDPGSAEDPAEPYRSVLAALRRVVTRQEGVVADAVSFGAGLLGDEVIGAIVADLLEEIKTRIRRIELGSVAPAASELWPEYWTCTEQSRSSFFRALTPLTTNSAVHFGAALSPIVDGVRVRGPLRPTWSSADHPLMLVDSEGLGHTIETVAALPSDVVDQLDRVDTIVMIDNAQQPMQAATVGALRQIAATGHAKKVVLGFTHFDRVTGPNLPTVSSRWRHLQASFAQVIDGLGTELGEGVRQSLNDVADRRTFYLSNLQQHLDPVADADAIEQLGRLLSLIGSSSKPETVSGSQPVIDEQALADAVVEGLRAFQLRWWNMLGLAGNRSAGWSQMKALSRRFADGQAEEYKELRPVADYASSMTTAVRRAVDSPVGWAGPIDADHAHACEDALARSVHLAFVHHARRQLCDVAREQWVAAAALRGPRSVERRSALIADEILIRLLPLDRSHPNHIELVQIIKRHALCAGYRLDAGSSLAPPLL